MPSNKRRREKSKLGREQGLCRAGGIKPCTEAPRRGRGLAWECNALRKEWVEKEA